MKGVAIHALLALIGLGLAYQTWTREEDTEERPPGEVEVLACDLDQLKALSIETPTHLVDVEPQGKGEGRVYWISSQRKDPEKKQEDEEPASTPLDGGAPDAQAPDEASGAAGAPAPDAGAADAGAPVEEVKKPAKRKVDPLAPVRFVAKPAFDEYLAMLTPLRAIRGLGVVDEKRLGEFGFDEVGTYWRLECGGKVSLDVGGRTYGTGNRYLRNPESGEVYLVEGKLVQDLQSAQFKFMQTSLHDFELSDVDEARVAAQGAERHLLHRNRRVKGQARWVDAAEPDRRNELFGNWFGRVEKLRARNFLGPDEKPGDDLEGGEVGEPEHVMTISYVAEGKPKGEVEIVRVRSMDAEFFYARSEATHAWVTLYDTAAKGVAIDIAIIAGADEMPELDENGAVRPPAQSPAAPAPASPPASPASPHASPASPHASPASPHAPAAPANPHAPPGNPHAPVAPR